MSSLADERSTSSCSRLGRIPRPHRAGQRIVGHGRPSLPQPHRRALGPPSSRWHAVSRLVAMDSAARFGTARRARCHDRPRPRPACPIRGDESAAWDLSSPAVANGTSYRTSYACTLPPNGRDTLESDLRGNYQTFTASFGIHDDSRDRSRHDVDEVELADLPCFGRRTRLVWHKRRWKCPNPAYRVVTFTEIERIDVPEADITRCWRCASRPTSPRRHPAAGQRQCEHRCRSCRAARRRARPAPARVAPRA